MQYSSLLHLILAAILIFFNSIEATPYIRGQYVSEDVWNELLPYFVPEDSPEKAALDEIFEKSRVVSSKKSMKKAGFLLLVEGKKIQVTRHHLLKGFIVKTFLDLPETESDPEIRKCDEDWLWWKKRCDGSRVIQASIERHGYQNIMKVPKKWIYPLPSKHAHKQGYVRRNFILLVEDMYAYNTFDNEWAYRKLMTPKLLDAHYTMIAENLLYDSVHPGNVRFCKDGKLAYLDTEYFHDTLHAMPFETLTHNLSYSMRRYWEALIRNGGPNH